MIRILINFLLFDIGWAACVLGGNIVAIIVTPLILWIHFSQISRCPNEGLFILVAALLGIAIDTLLMHAGILVFPGQGILCPLWLMCLWFLFPTTINHTLWWARSNPVAASVLGGILGPLSYYTGMNLTDGSFTDPPWISVLILIAIWILLLPVLIGIARAIVRSPAARRK